MEILDGLAARGGVAVLNGDEPLLWKKRDRIYGRKVWFGMENPECDVRAQDIESTADGVSFTLCLPETAFPVQLHLPGVHNVGNALAAAAVGWLLGVDADDISAALAEYQPDGRRQQLYEKNGFTIYEDCYNASPDSMQAALRVLGAQHGRRFAVLGCYARTGRACGGGAPHDRVLQRQRMPMRSICSAAMLRIWRRVHARAAWQRNKSGCSTRMRPWRTR